MDALLGSVRRVVRMSIPDRADRIDWRELYTEEGELAGVFHISSLIRLDIGPGSVLSPEILEALCTADLRRAVRDKALWYLARKDRTTTEVVRYLSRKPQPGFEKTVVRAVVEELREEGLLDDRALASRLADQAATRSARGESRLMILGRMRERGISARDAKAALDEHPVDELRGAHDFARRKLMDIDRRLSRADEQALAGPSASRRFFADVHRRNRRRRDALAGYLARKGYSSTTIRAVLDELLDDSEED